MTSGLQGTVIFILCSFGTHGTGAQVTFIAPLENTTVCRGSDVNISCGYKSATAIPIKWWINGTEFTQEDLQNNPLYQLNSPTSPMTYSLTVFSIDGTTTFQCVVLSDPTITSTLGTVIVNGPPTLHLAVNIMEDIESLSIVIQWNALDDSLTTTYIVTWTKAGSDIQVASKIEQTSYTITGLTLNTVYAITVSAANRCGQGPEFSTSISISADASSRSRSISRTVTNPSSTLDPSKTIPIISSISPTGTAISTTNTVTTTTIVNAITTSNRPTTSTTDFTTAIASVTTYNTIILSMTSTTTITFSAAYSNTTNPVATHFGDSGAVNDNSGGGSVGAIAGGVIGGIILVIIIIIIIAVIFYLFFCKNKDNDDSKSPYYSVIASNGSSNGKSVLAVSNNETCNKLHKLEPKTVPHHTTEAGEIYAISTKKVNDDASNELYTYARVDQRKIVETSVPHQAAADGVQYAVSTKIATNKDERTTDKHRDKNIKDKTINYADLELLPSPAATSDVRNESSSQYAQLAI